MPFIVASPSNPPNAVVPSDWPFAVTVTLVTTTVTGRDDYGKDILATVETPSPGWVVWPATQGSEATQGQDIITDTVVALAPPGTVVKATDQVKVFGRTYEVQGNPWSWQSPLTGTTPGVQVDLKAVTG